MTESTMVTVLGPDGTTEDGCNWALSFTVPGHQPRKSNDRGIVPGKKGKSISIKSAPAQAYVKAAMMWILQHPRLRLDLHEALELDAVIYYANKMSDLSDELLCDILEDMEIIRNDNFIRRKHLDWQYDPDNPRCEVTLRPLPNHPVEWLVKHKSKGELAIARLKRKSNGR